MHPHLEKLLSIACAGSPSSNTAPDPKAAEGGSTDQAAEGVAGDPAVSRQSPSSALAAPPSADPSSLPPGFSLAAAQMTSDASAAALPHATQQQPLSLPAAPASPLPFTGRGGPICRADACLFISCMPPAVSERQLVTECSKTSSVESVHMWSSPLGQGLGLGQGEAYVVFATTIP